MKQFLIKSTVLTLIVLTAGIFLYSTILGPYYLSILPLIVVLFYMVTNLVHAYLLNISGKSSGRFASRYMAISFMKMFFYLAVAIGYVFFNRDQAKVFIANFIVLYFIYTIFEVNEFLKVVKNIK